MSNKGLVWEKKVASHLRSLGYFTRSNICVSTSGTGNRQDFLEIDLIGFSIAPLKTIRILGECKSGRASTGDLFRLIGLMTILNADKVLYAKRSIPEGIIKYFQNSFDFKNQTTFITKSSELKVWDMENLIELTSYNSLFKMSYIRSKFTNREIINFLTATIRFLQGDFWIKTPTENIKKFPLIFNKLLRFITIEENEENIKELKKLLFESIILFALTILIISSEYFNYSKQEFSSILKERILFSPFSKEELIKLERKINDFLRINCNNFTKPIELTSQPLYIDYLIDLVWRLNQSNVNFMSLLLNLEKLFWNVLGFRTNPIDSDEAERKQLQNIINISLKLADLNETHTKEIEKKIGLSEILDISFLERN